MRAQVLLIAALCFSAAHSTEVEYVTHYPPAFEPCMEGCDRATDGCLADDTLDQNGIALCEEALTNCYRRCASREAHRRAKEAGHNLKCEIA